MNRKSVLWLSHLIPYPPKGGVLQRSYNLLRELSLYHDVHLIAFSQEGLLKLHYETVEQGIAETTKVLEPLCKSISVIDMPLQGNKYAKPLIALKSLFTKTPYTINWLKSDQYQSAISSTLSAQDIDIIYCDTISLALYHKEFQGKPFIVGHHNIESDMMFRRSEKDANLLKKLYFYIEAKKIEYYERLLCDNAAANITCSILDSQRLKQITPDALITEAPNGVDINYFAGNERTLSSKESIKFIFAGRLNAYTNEKAALQFAFEIWPKLQSAYPNATAYIVGSNPPRQLVKLAEGDDRLIVTGYVDDVRPYLEDADIYICPIDDGGGTKLKVLDALAMGIPIVANEIACEGINVENEKSILFAETPDQYLSQVKKLLEGPELYNSMSRNSIELVKSEYSYPSIGRNLSIFFSELPKVTH